MSIVAGCSNKELLERSMKAFEPTDEDPPIVHAIEDGDLNAVQRIVAEYPEIVNQPMSPEIPEHPLHYAIWQGKPAIVGFLLERNADVNSRGENGETPLHYAAKHGYPEIAKILIERGADVNAENDGGFTPLFAASRGREQECVEVVEVFERAGARIGLNEWICMGRLEKVKTILNSDANACLKARFPAFLIEDMITLIQCRMWEKAGHNPRAKPDAEDDVVAETLPVLEQMLDQGADPNGGFGTALFYAVQLPKLEFAKLLLERGTSIKQMKERGHDPMKIAQANDMRRLLRSFGA